jgi:hypothetical protein
VADGSPLWRQAFDAVERRVGPPLEAAVRSNAFADGVALGWRARRRVQRELERRSRRVLHTANLPAATDVRRVSEQVSALQREVRALQRELERERSGAGDGDRPRSRARR